MTPPLWSAATALLDDGFPLPLDRPFTSRDAAAAGVSKQALARLERLGLIRRLLRGVYAAAQVPDTLMVRAEALALVAPEHAVITDWTACWLWTGLLQFGDHLEVPPVHLFREAGHHRLRNDLCRSGERTFLREDITEYAGLRVSTPLRTALDLGRLERRDSAIVALDGLLREGSFEHDELLAGIERFRGQRGVVQLRALAPLADPRSESAGESVLRLRWLDMSKLPPPTPQVSVEVDGVEVARIDLAVPELLFGAEYDGEVYHSTDQDRAHDRNRRGWLDRERGWLIEVVGKANVFGARRDVEEILTRGIVAARRRLGLPSWG